MTPKKRRDSVDEASFEGLMDLGTIPPPTSGPTPVDVHAASTAVAELPPGLLEELRRAKPAETQFADELPTTPGKERLRNTDLLAAVNAALAEPAPRPPPAPTPPAAPAFAFPAIEHAAAPRRTPKRRRRVVLLFVVAVLLALAAIFAVRRFVRHR